MVESCMQSISDFVELLEIEFKISSIMHLESSQCKSNEWLFDEHSDRQKHLQKIIDNKNLNKKMWSASSLPEK